MDSNISNEIENLKKIYYDIINGHSYDNENDVYIKHFSEIENSEIINKKSYFFEKFKKDGIPTFQDKLNELIKNGEWNQDDEDEILSYKLQISDNEKHVQTIIPIQRPAIEQVIKNTKNKLTQKLIERKSLIGSTAEDFSENKVENYFLYYTLYKDKELKIKLFDNYEELENLDFLEVKKFFDLVNNKLKEFNENTIYKVSIMPFFLNVFSYCKDNIYAFLGKPICQLTSYQTLLLSLGQRNLMVLSNAKGSPPEIFEVKDINEIIRFYDQEYSLLKSKNSSQESGINMTSREIVTRHY